jgi:phosphoglucomutase
MDAIRAAGLELAVDPRGGAAIDYWEPINAIYELTSLSSIHWSIRPSRS